MFSFKPTNTNKQVDVIVKQGSSNSTSPQQFTYDFTNTIVISSISPSVLSVLGKYRENFKKFQPNSNKKYYNQRRSKYNNNRTKLTAQSSKRKDR